MILNTVFAGHLVAALLDHSAAIRLTRLPAEPLRNRNQQYTFLWDIAFENGRDSDEDIDTKGYFLLWLLRYAVSGRIGIIEDLFS